MAIIGKTHQHSARLRRESTDAEKRLWYHLRNRNLGGFKFRRQVTIGPFIADFACIEARVIVEADGSQHGPGRDAGRTEYLETLDWKVVRFWNDEILTQTAAVLEFILQHCRERHKEKPSPNPLPQAGEGI